MERVEGKDKFPLVVSASVAAKSLLQKMDPAGVIEGLVEEARMAAMMLVFGLATSGYGRARALSGHRTLLVQEMIYGLGRTAAQCRRAGIDPALARPGEPRATWGRPRDSDHVRGMALDVDFSMYDYDRPPEVERVCRALNVEWGGWWKVRDFGHFGFRRGYNGPK